MLVQQLPHELRQRGRAQQVAHAELETENGIEHVHDLEAGDGIAAERVEIVAQLELRIAEHLAPHVGARLVRQRIAQALDAGDARGFAPDDRQDLLRIQWWHLAGAGIAFTRLDGSTRDRGAVVAHFQAESGPPVLLISLGAGGLGLNLTAADHVFILDPWWNPAVEEQAADRAHRIGQDRPVMVYRLVAQDTIEERVLALQQHKRGLAAAALAGAGGAGGITREDLLALLA